MNLSLIFLQHPFVEDGSSACTVYTSTLLIKMIIILLFKLLNENLGLKKNHVKFITFLTRSLFLSISFCSYFKDNDFNFISYKKASSSGLNFIAVVIYMLVFKNTPSCLIHSLNLLPLYCLM